MTQTSNPIMVHRNLETEERKKIDKEIVLDEDFEIGAIKGQLEKYQVEFEGVKDSGRRASIKGSQHDVSEFSPTDTKKPEFKQNKPKK